MTYYLVKIVAEDRREDFRLIKNLTIAENRYFRAFAAVVNQDWPQTVDGGRERLIGCYLYEVGIDDMITARERVRNNTARRLQSSDDSMCGVPVVIEDLFGSID